MAGYKIQRDNIPNSKHTVVCERHWPEGYPTILDYEKNRPRDPPSVFTCVKSSLIPTQPPPMRNVDKLAAASRNVIPDEYDEFMCCSGQRVKCLTKDTSRALSRTCNVGLWLTLLIFCCSKNKWNR